MPEFKVIEVGWATAQAPISAIRRAVFVEEQGVPEDLEWDGCDTGARHVLAFVGSEPVATGRLLASGHIGRMAVLSQFRRQGVGRSILHALLRLAQHGALAEVFLNAQVQASGFYSSQGFTQSGEVFFDAGISHVCMRRGFEPQTDNDFKIELKSSIKN